MSLALGVGCALWGVKNIREEKFGAGLLALDVGCVNLIQAAQYTPMGGGEIGTFLMCVLFLLLSVQPVLFLWYASDNGTWVLGRWVEKLTWSVGWIGVIILFIASLRGEPCLKDLYELSITCGDETMSYVAPVGHVAWSYKLNVGLHAFLFIEFFILIMMMFYVNSSSIALAIANFTIIIVSTRLWGGNVGGAMWCMSAGVLFLITGLRWTVSLMISRSPAKRGTTQSPPRG